MSKLNKIIMAVAYPIANKDSVKFVRGFKALSNGGIEPLFTGAPELAQKFGPEGQLHINWLNGSPSKELIDAQHYAYSLFDAPEVPTELFDDGKDYSMVDIAVAINSTYETGQLYNAYCEAKWKYQQDMGGNLITVGKLEGAPVCIAPMIHTIEGVRVLYVEATSGVVCHTMIEAWVKAKINNPKVEFLTSPDRLVYEIRDKIAEKKQAEVDKTIAA